MKERKEPSFQSNLYLALIFILLYLALTGLPLTYWGMEPFSANLTMAVFRFVYGTVVFFLLRFYFFPKLKILPSLRGVLFLPFFLLCFSNLIYWAVMGGNFSSLKDNMTLWHNLWHYASIAFAEEVVFRQSLMGILSKRFKKYQNILISAGIFGVAHLINLFNGASLGATFAQVGYTFVLGLLLGFVELYGGGFLSAFLLHFAFDYVNMGIFELVFQGNWDWPFFLINIGIGVVVLGYAFFLFFLFEKKEKKSLVETPK